MCLCVIVKGCQFKASLLSDGTIEGGVARGQSAAARGQSSAAARGQSSAAARGQSAAARGQSAAARGQSAAAARRHSVHHQPQQWVKACWTQLGHPHKKISRKLAYTTVNNFC